ncbi:hypothetical protein LFM09_46245 [Lentzea alba]|uniref:hypothetical protein n=1 Tax=Lentzea alba TaxID=2714351 RepID=UPI0039BFEDAD
MIGILGAYGDVGTHAVRMLQGHDLRLGCRRSGVDFHDQASLDRFAAGCRIVVNCAGPAHLVGDRVLRAAERAGADYVDASGDVTPFAGTAVVGAGLQPGLTGLLPRWVGSDELTLYLGVLDRFTETAAADYLYGVNSPLAAWRDGPVPRALTRRSGVTLPFFPGEVTLLPYLDAEACRIAEQLKLRRGDWYTAVSGEHVLRAFDRLHGMERAEAVPALCRASRLDLAGREPHVVLAVETTGRTVVLRGRSNGELTGTVVALAVEAVDRGEVPPGCHHASDVLDPSIVEQLLDRVEEGAL